MTTGIRCAIEDLEKENAGLQPELMSAESARELMAFYAHAEKLVAFGLASLSRKVHDPAEIAKVTGTSMGKAKATVATGQAMEASDDLSLALQQGDISLDQAAEISSAVESAPESAKELVKVAKKEAFNVLRDKARKAKLEAEQHRGLAGRQRAARSARSYSDALGLTHIHLALEPHVGTPIVARAEAEAQRRAKAAKKSGTQEPFEAHLADAYAVMLSGAAVKGSARRPELVVLVSHEVIKRGYKDVRDDEICKIPGVGPVAPSVAREIARDAFLNGVFYDGKDLRHFKRWGRCRPQEITLALELGKPPDFDGIKCSKCGNRFRTEIDHIEPVAAGGPTALLNLEPDCWSCHHEKTEGDRKAGKLRPPDP